MISKDNFYKIFPFKVEDEIAARIYDKYVIADRSGNSSVVKYFLTPQYWSSLERFCRDNSIAYLSEGFFEEAQRKIFIFNYEEEDYIPAVVLKIINKSKFSKLMHKDYLGALLALGIERHTVGDIIVSDNIAYVAVLEDISQYVIDNLITIGKSPCLIEVLTNIQELPTVSKKEMEIIVTSRRLDNFISSICGVSRTEAIKLIDQGKVLLEYLETREKSALVKDNSTITVRGYGKFDIDNTIRRTKSDRQIVRVHKYI